MRINISSAMEPDPPCKARGGGHPHAAVAQGCDSPLRSYHEKAQVLTDSCSSITLASFYKQAPRQFCMAFGGHCSESSALDRESGQGVHSPSKLQKIQNTGGSRPNSGSQGHFHWVAECVVKKCYSISSGF